MTEGTAESTLDSMSKQEKIAWISLGATLLIMGYFVESMFDYNWQLDIYSRAMAKIITNSMMLGVGAEILYGIIRRQPAMDAVEDERDVQIRNTATLISYRFLVVLLVGAMGTLVWTPSVRLEAVSPVLMAYVLLAMLTATGIVKNVAEIVQYRLGA